MLLFFINYYLYDFIKFLKLCLQCMCIRINYTKDWTTVFFHILRPNLRYCRQDFSRYNFHHRLYLYYNNIQILFRMVTRDHGQQAKHTRAVELCGVREYNIIINQTERGGGGYSSLDLFICFNDTPSLCARNIKPTKNVL